MKQYKLFLCLFFLLISFNTVYSQVIKLKAYAFSYKTQKKFGWSDWMEWQNCKILITIDLNEDRIKIYSKLTQEYDIISSEMEKYDSEGNKYIKLSCIDEFGLRCNVRVVSRSNDNREMYVDYSDVIWVYSVYRLD